MTAVVRRSWRRAGRVVPSTAARLRGRSMRLAAGSVVEWHSTHEREELLTILEGSVRLEVEQSGAIRRVACSAGQCVFVPSQTRHRVVNNSRRPARYIYITG